MLFTRHYGRIHIRARYNVRVNVPASRDSPLLEALAARFPLVTVPVEAAGRTWNITAVQDQDALLAGVQSDADVDQFPFGLLLWASAVGLARRLAEEPSLVRGRRVLEIGAGVGLPGLVAAGALGAERVVQTDYQAGALALCARNAAQNGLGDSPVLSRTTGDWRAFPDLGQPFPLVIGSDVLYERALHPALHDLLPRLVAPGGRVLLSDPVRPQALSFIEACERGGAWRVEMESRLVEWEGDRREVAIFSLYCLPEEYV